MNQGKETSDLEKVYELEKAAYIRYNGWPDSTVRKLLEHRNAYFAKRLVELNNTKKVDFFAIGAAHFGGDDSVVRNLEKLGIKVVPAFLNEIENGKFNTPSEIVE